MRADKLDKALRRLNMLNPDIGIKSFADHGFESYGRILKGIGKETLLSRLSDYKPGKDVVYRPEIRRAEDEREGLSAIAKEAFDGKNDLQLGVVYGRNRRLNALEYHKSAEVIVTGFPMVMMMGLVCQIEWPKGIFDISKIRAFYVPKGAVFELFPWCLHYVPIHVYEEDGFKCLVVLPFGTNAPLDYEPEREGEGKMMLARNKWLLAHSDDSSFDGQNAHLGLVGRNIEIKTL